MRTSFETYINSDTQTSNRRKKTGIIMKVIKHHHHHHHHRNNNSHVRTFSVFVHVVLGYAVQCCAAGWKWLMLKNAENDQFLHKKNVKTFWLTHTRILYCCCYFCYLHHFALLVIVIAWKHQQKVCVLIFFILTSQSNSCV